MSQVLSNKAIQKKEIATPSNNPPPGYVFEYFKSDGSLYRKNSAGVEVQLDGLLLLSKQVSLTSEQLQNGVTSPIDTGITEPGAGKYIVVTSMQVDFTAGVTVFDFNKGNLVLISDGAIDQQSTTANFLNSASSAFTMGVINNPASTQLTENSKLYVRGDTDATQGNGSLICYITYFILSE